MYLFVFCLNILFSLKLYYEATIFFYVLKEYQCFSKCGLWTICPGVLVKDAGSSAPFQTT